MYDNKSVIISVMIHDYNGLKVSKFLEKEFKLRITS